MADTQINIEKSEEQQKFIFGQNMEDRVVNVPPDSGGDEEGPDSTQENGNEKEEDGNSDGPPSLFRPSAFTPKPGILAPSRLGSVGNPFVSKSPVQNAPSSSDSGGGGNVLGSSSLSQNPFASRVSAQAVSAPNSDSEDERRDKPIVAPTHFGVTSATKLSSKIATAGVTTGNGATPSKFVLRPSALDHQTVNFGKDMNNFAPSYKSSFKLEPAKLQSPLVSSKTKGAGDDESSEAEAAVPVSAVSEEATKQRLFGGVPQSDTQGSEADEAAAKVSSADSEESSRLKSPSQPDGDCQEEKPDSGGTNFVFGQNMEERVTNATTPTLTGAEEGNFVFGENLGDRVTSTTKSPNNTPEDNAKSPAVDDAETPNKTLAESAAAHQAKLARPELQEVEVKTGEENESNVFQINAKLFAFEKSNQSWLEKGRGLLRLNDMSENDDTSFQSRLVMRTQGSLRVVLNTKIWAAMTVERASQKSIRITAVDSDDGSVRVYLIMANPKDADQIFSAIDWRVQQLKTQDQTGEEKRVESSQADSTVAESEAATSQAEKRPNEDSPEETTAPAKKVRVDPSERREILTEESNDSSTIDPETEASNESFSSTNKSSSSE